MNDTLTLVVYVVFGAFGMGYFIYGKRQSKIVPLISGAGLIIYPYFFDNALILLAVGIIFLGLPYFLRY